MDGLQTGREEDRRETVFAKSETGEKKLSFPLERIGKIKERMEQDHEGEQGREKTGSGREEKEKEREHKGA